MAARWARWIVVGLLAGEPAALWAQQFPPPIDQPAAAPKAKKKKQPAPEQHDAPVVNLPDEPDQADQLSPGQIQAAPPPPKRGAAAAPAHAVNCAGAFAKASSHLRLAQIYGPQNLEFSEVDGPENSKLRASVLYPKDPKRRLEVLWSNEGSRSDTSLVAINGQSTWSGPKGLHLGMPIAAVEKINGKPFQLAGFDQENAGTVTDWQGGGLDKLPGGCKVSVRVAPDAKASEAARTAAAGKTLPSNDALVKAVQPKVAEILIGY